MTQTKPVAILRATADGWEAVREDNGELIRSEQLTNATPSDLKRIKRELLREVTNHRGYQVRYI